VSKETFLSDVMVKKCQKRPSLDAAEQGASLARKLRPNRAGSEGGAGGAGRARKETYALIEGVGNFLRQGP
jgi:hypothetical protein